MKKIVITTLAVAGAFTAVFPAHVSANHSMEASESMASMSTTMTSTPAVTTGVAVTAPAVPSTCEFTQNLGKGDKGGDVLCLQQELIEAGVLTTIDAPTGNYGDLTVAAVKAWQVAHNINATGYFGPLTRAAIHEHVHEETGMPAIAHGHEAHDVSGWAHVPTLAATLHPDAMGGYNLETAITHFAFAPAHVNGAVVEGEGHIHVYINDVKLGRYYGSWVYLPATAFKKGENTVRVTLNANDHSELKAGGKIIEATSTVTVK